jgi:hypothetical protein
MKKATQIMGWIGAVILGLGLVSRLIQQQGSLFISLHIAMGSFLIVVAVLSNLPEIRAFLTGRIARAGSSAFISILLMVILIFIINYLVMKRDHSFDFTSRSIYSLSKPTLKILDAQIVEVHVTAFFQPDKYVDTKRRLDLYSEKSNKIKIDFIDPDKHPEAVANKGIEYLKAGSILFEAGEQSTLITQHDEADITNAIISVMREESPVIYFLTGHGEADIEDKDKSGFSILADALRHQNYQLEKLVLAGRVPKDSAALIIAGPRLKFTAHELEALDFYITQGGNALFLIDPIFTKSYQTFITGLESFLMGYGIIPGSGMIADPVYNFRRDVLGLTPITKDIREHPVTHGIENKLLVFPQPRPLLHVSKGPEAHTWNEMILTSEESFIEGNVRDIFEKQYVHLDDEDIKGSFLLAASKSWKQSLPRWQEAQGGRQKETRLIVVGNSLFLRNGYIEIYSNYNFALNMINWLAGEEKMIHLRPKKRSSSRLYLSKRQTDLIFYVSVLVLPELLLIIGVGIWWRKR